MQYRREIDGLRAIAVISVILFHAELSSCSGGFVGVDIFYVISGYLITSLILAASDEFSFRTFYERRARRLLPALFFIMFVCIIPAWLWMMPDLLENFGQSVVATVLFGNNILLWHTIDYFSLDGRYRPLLHTWSLGVEEQFYILFPVLVIAFRRFARAWLVPGLAAMTIASFVAAEFMLAEHATAAFFLLPFRAWELLAGALCAFVPRRPIPAASGSIAGLMALVAIGYSVFTFDSATPSPGHHMLLPVGATAVIILLAREETLIGRLLSWRPLVSIGIVSYSAYLWHQPLFAFARLRSLSAPSDGEQLLLAAASIVLAYPTWRFVEQPFRRGFSARRIALLFLASSIILVAVGMIFHLTAGAAGRMSAAVTDESGGSRQTNMAYVQRAFRYEGRRFVDPAKSNVLVIGDSFARDFINAALENGYLSDAEISYANTKPICVGARNPLAADLRSRLAQADVVIFGSPAIDLACWKNDFRIFRGLGAERIIVIDTKNFGWNMNAALLLPREERVSYRAEVLANVVALNESHKAALPASVFVDLLGLIGDREGRVPLYTEDGMLISWDQIHLTRAGARWMGRRLFEHPLLRDLK